MAFTDLTVNEQTQVRDFVRDWLGRVISGR